MQYKPDPGSNYLQIQPGKSPYVYPSMSNSPGSLMLDDFYGFYYGDIHRCSKLLGVHLKIIALFCWFLTKCLYYAVGFISVSCYLIRY